MSESYNKQLGNCFQLSTTKKVVHTRCLWHNTEHTIATQAYLDEIMACSKYSNNVASGNGSNLCDDLLIEIITRLPPKSAFRSKCVSKTWHLLISSVHVQKKLPFTISGIYRNDNTRSSKHQYACLSGGKFIGCDLRFLPFTPDLRIISCCNGLFLFELHSSKVLHVCNPATRRWLPLPSLNKPSLISVLAFDPCISQHYKVICFTSWQTQGAELEVFSSETGEWVELDMQWGVKSVTILPVMTYFNGVLYILSYPHCIVCINLETMKTRRVELPAPVKNGAHVGRNGGKLCYYAGNDGNREPSVWMLGDLDNCRWELMGCISLKAVTEQESNKLSGVQVRFLAFHPELEVVYFFVAEKLVSYDMRKKRIKEVGDFGMERERGCLVQIWLFQFSNYLSDCLLMEQE